jgi:hypothetical protein
LTMVYPKAVWLAFSSAAFLALTELASAEEVPCTENLICNHGAGCIQGVANFTVHMGLASSNGNGNSAAADFMDITPPDFLAVSQVDNQHCACPIGWTGVTCEVEYKSCDQTHPCFHGGQCILGLNDRYGNEQLFCNCDNAVDQEGNKYGTCKCGAFCSKLSITLFFLFDFSMAFISSSSSSSFANLSWKILRAERGTELQR